MIYKYMEFIIFSLYLIFIFLSIQIWFLWKDTDKNELKIKIISESFFKKNCIYVFSFGVFFIIQSIEIMNQPDASMLYEFIKILALISLLLFTYGWYRLLKNFTHKRSFPQEFFDLRKKSKY